MTTTDELGFLDATGQAELVRKKEVTAAELVDGAIERVERLNPILNAVITPMYDNARESASQTIPNGPFTGVPFLVKDFLAEYAGVRFTESSNFIGDFVPDEDTELVKRCHPDAIDPDWFRPFLRMACQHTNERGSAWQPLFLGPRDGRWSRLWRHWSGR